MLLLLNWRVWVAVALAVGLAASHWRAYKQGEKSAALECSIERQAASEQARERRDAQQAVARAAEAKYAERETKRTAVAEKTLLEVRDETANLALCRLDAGDVWMLNAAASGTGSN